MMKRLFGAVLAVALVISFFALFVSHAYAASDMKASNECIEMLKETEGFRAIPYWDYSQWTVGFGTACPDEYLEEYKLNGIPVADAEALLYEHLAKFEKAVNQFADKHGLTLTQSQFDALVSFTYNLGASTLTRSGSTIANAILSGATDNELIFAFSIYCMAGGEFMPGLMRRRLAEANMFINGIYDDYAPDSYCYVRYDANGGVRDCSAQGYDANMPAVPMSKPTYEGYAFVGWFTQPEGGVKITNLDETTHGMTLYAHWQKSETEVEQPTDPTEGISVIVVSATVNVRCGPGIGYGIVSDVHAGDKLTIIGTTLYNGELWGQFEEGWICLVHTNYHEIVAPDTEDEDTYPDWQVPVLATVVNSSGIIVYNGPHTTYPQLKTLPLDTQILLLETMVFAGKQWARYEGGWVQMDVKLLVHDENKLAHNFTALTTNAVAVRSGAGASYSKVTTLSKDTSHTVYAIVMVDGTPWGRVAKGWINLNYTDYDVSRLSQYQNHAYGDWYVSTASTCVTPGQERHDCQYCDHYETREAALGDHSYGDWYVVQEADCITDGLEQRDCQYCDHSQTRAITCGGHVWGDWTVILEATCTEGGQEQRTCQRCGSQETRDVAANGHSFGAWYETKAATAEEPGEERRDCQNCDHYETRETAATEHNFGQWYVTVAATCTESGQERRDCQDCDHYETRDVEPTGHSLDQWYVSQEPTCTEPGRERRDCANCDHYESRELEALGHSMGDWYESIAPTVTECGQERRDCQRCDHYETRELDKLPAPTVTRTYATVTCSVLRVRSGPGTNYEVVAKLYLGDRVEVLEIQTIGDSDWGRIEQGWICLTGLTDLSYEEETHTHTYGAWYTYQEATCTDDGILRRDCTCGHYETQAIAATGHSYGDWYVTKEATAEDYGQERRDCACGHYETRQTDKLDVTIKIYATITCEALSIRTGAGTGYSRIGFYYKGQTVEILDQVQVGSSTWGKTDKGWICLTGYTTLKEVQETVAHTHSYGDWYVTKEATTEEYGQERRDCACGHYETRQTDKLEAVAKIYATITCEVLIIREGAGTGYARIGSYYKGQTVEILEQVQVGSNTWGRTDKGWICLTGYTILQTIT